jgi:hypothetical protein
VNGVNGVNGINGTHNEVGSGENFGVDRMDLGLSYSYIDVGGEEEGGLGSLPII